MESAGLVAAGVAAFRGERLVLRDVALAVPRGGAAVLTGPNGAGKSTLLRVLAGLKRPDAGTISWDGGPVGQGVCAYLGHQDAIKPGLTLRENLAFPPPVRDVLDALDLRALADLPARMLSAGQKRRAGLARVAASPAPIWLLDEPSLGLDSASIDGLARLLADHRARGGAVVAATHLPLPLPGAVALSLGERNPAASTGT